MIVANHNPSLLPLESIDIHVIDTNWRVEQLVD